MKYPNVTAGQTEAIINILGGWEKFQQVLGGAAKVLVQLTELLKYLTETSVSGSRKFVAKNHFIQNTSPIAKVKIGWLGDNFKTYFLAKVERNIQPTTLVVHQLVKDSLDQPILDQLGDKFETSLAHLYELLSRQPRGESGILLNNGYANIFYIKDAKGTVWAVNVLCIAFFGGWYVSVHSVSRPHRWTQGSQILSRK